LVIIGTLHNIIKEKFFILPETMILVKKKNGQP